MELNAEGVELQQLSYSCLTPSELGALFNYFYSC